MHLMSHPALPPTHLCLSFKVDGLSLHPVKLTKLSLCDRQMASSQHRRTLSFLQPNALGTQKNPSADLPESTLRDKLWPLPPCEQKQACRNPCAAPGPGPVRPGIDGGSVEFPCHIKPRWGQEGDTLIREQKGIFHCLLSGFHWGR